MLSIPPPPNAAPITLLNLCPQPCPSPCYFISHPPVSPPTPVKCMARTADLLPPSGPHPLQPPCIQIPTCAHPCNIMLPLATPRTQPPAPMANQHTLHSHNAQQQSTTSPPTLQATSPSPSHIHLLPTTQEIHQHTKWHPQMTHQPPIVPSHPQMTLTSTTCKC